jgi:hypothetical protein
MLLLGWGVSPVCPAQHGQHLTLEQLLARQPTHYQVLRRRRRRRRRRHNQVAVLST